MSLSNPPPPPPSARGKLSDALGGPNAFKTMPGIDGIPHRSRTAWSFKETDPPHMRPQDAGEFHCHTFDLGDPQSVILYQQVHTSIYNGGLTGASALVHIDRRFDEKRGVWVIYMEWFDYFTRDPKGIENRGDSAYSLRYGR